MSSSDESGSDQPISSCPTLPNKDHVESGKATIESKDDLLPPDEFKVLLKAIRLLLQRMTRSGAQLLGGLTKTRMQL